MANQVNLSLILINLLKKGEMVTETANLTWKKDHLKVAINPIAEALPSQGAVIDDMDDFNHVSHKANHQK